MQFRKWSRSIVLFGCATLLLSSLISCHKIERKVIQGPDGKFQITVPGGWKKDLRLHDDAEIQASHRRTNMFVIVLAEDKVDLSPISLEEHSKLTRESLLESLTNIEVLEPVHLTIDGYPAIQYEIRATKDHLRIIYFHTTIESPTHFYQIVAWTVPSQIKKDPHTLKKITEYFREIR